MCDEKIEDFNVAKFIMTGSDVTLVIEKEDWTFKHMNNPPEYPSSGWIVDEDTPENGYIQYNSTYQIYDEWYTETPSLFSFLAACPLYQPTGWTIRTLPHGTVHAPTYSCPQYSGCFLTKSPLPDSYDCECFSGFVKTIFLDGTRDDSYPNYLATASTSANGHGPSLAHDGMRSTCWKPTRLQNTARVGEWQSALRLTFPNDGNGNGVSETIVGGVRIYTNYWNTYARDYEHLTVSVCEWIPGREFSYPVGGDEVDEMYSPEEEYFLNTAHATGYTDGDCGSPYTKIPVKPGYYEWYEGSYVDWICGRTNRDLFDG